MLKKSIVIVMIMIMTMSVIYGGNEEARKWNEKGAELYKEGKYEEALKCYDRAVEIDSSVWQVWYNRGNACYKLGNYEKACGSYNKVLELDKNNIQAYYKKGLCLNKLSRYEEAIKCFDVVLKKNPNDADAKAGKEEAKKGLGNNYSSPTPYVNVPTPAVNVSQGNPVEPEMVYIEGGTFNMGSNKGQSGEKPVHSVTVSSFYIGKYEVTNREYMRYDPKHKGNWSEEEYPVECVSWNDAMKYCEWISKKTGKKYRLPTEAEWEYACRSGTDTEYYWGDSINGDYCWYDGNSGNRVHPVGKKQPNSFGLYDMSGNVWEWCSDWYNEMYYGDSPSTNPKGPSSGSYRVERGGSWSNNVNFCRSALRNSYAPANSLSYLGFRLVRTP